MHNMSVIKVFICGLLGVCFVSGSVYGQNETFPKASLDWLKGVQSQEGKIIFWGKVVDQHGKAVPEASVLLHIQKASIMPRGPVIVEAVTDKQGCFSVKKGKGCGLYISKIEKEGYEWNYQYQSLAKRSFNYRNDEIPRHLPDADSPIVFPIRKKEQSPTFLFKESGFRLQIKAEESGATVGYDFLQHKRYDRKYAIRDVSEYSLCDFLVKATLNTNDLKWHVALFSGSTNGGILVSDQMLYEAPEDGYCAEYTFIPDDMKVPQKKFIYLQSQNPAIYTRIEIEHINADGQFFSLRGRSVTNPYGDRNLELATDIPYGVRKQLEGDAKKALRQNKHPKKPDLQKLLKQERGQSTSFSQP